MQLIYEKESYAILGACFEVYREQGHGFREPVYQECLEIELDLQGIPFSPQDPLRLSYKSRELRQRHTPDFSCYQKIIVEIKAATKLLDEHRAQLINYLKATGYRLGLLVNFGRQGNLEHERFVV